MKPHPYYVIGRHFFRHYRARAKAIGIAAAIKRMRKDGVPPAICALILTAQHEPTGPTPKPLTWFERIASLFTPSERTSP